MRSSGGVCDSEGPQHVSLDSSLYQILQILSLTLFEKTPILQAIQASDSQEEFLDPGNKLILFDL